MKRLFKLSLLTLILLAVLGVCLLSASIYTYSTLTKETLIARLSFDRTGNDRYELHLATRDGCDERTFEIYGDQWRLDAQFLKWKYWALLFGLDSQYRLDRVQGRYKDVSEQNTRREMAYDLAPDTSLDIVGVAAGLGPLNFLLDATYGSSTYQDIATDRAFYVYKTPTGIITRSEPEKQAGSERGRDGALPVDVSRACGARPGLWERISHWADAAVGAVLGRASAAERLFPAGTGPVH